MMSMAAMNDHLDTCLVQEEDVPPVGGACRGASGGEALAVSDDDEEPLAKRRGVDDSTEQVRFATFLSVF